ncbi:MAG: hypothetical protein BGO07_00255 [Alphaproteobacteria bacterium 40-19]|nr:MAG: hypothetical protein BGO07_00255 [Alphaproteobacteria bacterium 40-19]
MPAGHPITSKKGVCAGLGYLWIKDQLQGGGHFKILKRLIDSVLKREKQQKIYLKKNSWIWQRKGLTDCLEDVYSLQKNSEKYDMLGNLPRYTMIRFLLR